MSPIKERQRYHTPASQPLGRIDVRRQPRIRFDSRMKPRAWPTSFWLQSALFDRGQASRKAKFGALIARSMTLTPYARLNQERDEV